MDYKYYKFKFFEKYESIKKIITNIITKHEYEEVCSVSQNDNEITLYKKDKFLSLRDNYYILYVEGNKIKNEILSFLDRLIKEQINDSYFIIHIIFNIKEYSKDLDYFMKYGIILPDRSVRVISRGRSQFPIVIDTKNKSLYVGDYYPKLIYNPISHIIESMDEYYESKGIDILNTNDYFKIVKFVGKKKFVMNQTSICLNEEDKMKSLRISCIFKLLIFLVLTIAAIIQDSGLPVIMVLILMSFICVIGLIMSFAEK